MTCNDCVNLNNCRSGQSRLALGFSIENADIMCPKFALKSEIKGSTDFDKLHNDDYIKAVMYWLITHNKSEYDEILLMLMLRSLKEFGCLDKFNFCCDKYIEEFGKINGGNNDTLHDN